MNTIKHRIDSRDLDAFCSEILYKIGLPAEDAKYVAELLVEAELRGNSTHGIMRLKTYINFVEHGSMNTQPNINVLKDEKATGVIDGDNGFGQIVASNAMDLAIKKAKMYGIGIVGVRNSGHLGEIGLLTKKVVPHQMIGSISSNGGPMMAAWGATKPILGNNPFAVCIPRGEHPPITIDMALSKTARGNVILAEHEGKEIPEGWAIDKNGKPTTNPTEALLGSVLPMAEHKGYALSFMVEILTSILTGGLPGYSLGMLSPPEPGRPLGTTNLVTAINIDNFISWDSFQSNLENLINEIKETAQEDEEVFIPGERSMINREKNLSLGIALKQNMYSELIDLGERFGVNLHR